MPSKSVCKKSWKDMGYSDMKDCMDYGRKKMGSKPQKSSTNTFEEQDMVGTAIAKSKNVRMRNRLEKQAKSPYKIK